MFDILTEAGGPTANAGQVVAIAHRGDAKQQTVLLSQNPQKNMEADVPVGPAGLGSGEVLRKWGRIWGNWHYFAAESQSVRGARGEDSFTLCEVAE